MSEAAQDLIEVRLKRAAEVAPVRIVTHYVMSSTSTPIRSVMLEAAQELATLRAALSPEPVSMDGIHAAKSILIMQTAPIRLSIMQGRQVSDQDRAISNAVEDLDAAIKGFVRAAPSPPSFREIHPDEYTFGPGPGTLAEFKAQNPPVTDEHPLSGVTHEMWSEMVRMSNAPVGDGEVEAIRGRAENWPAIGLDDRPGALTPFGEACADRATLLRRVDALASELAAERERVERMREALEEMAYHPIGGIGSNAANFVRRARAALEQKP